MAQNKLILRKLTSPFGGEFIDTTKGSVLSHSELDSNQIFLKGELIYTATTSGNTVLFPQIVGTQIEVDLSTMLVGNDTFISGMSFDNGSYLLSIDRNDGTTFTESLASLASDIYVMGGVYNPVSGEIDFTTNSGDTFSVSGFTTGMTNFYTTGTTIDGTTLHFDRTDSLSAFTADLSTLLGPYDESAPTRILPRNNIGNSNDSDNSTIGGGINNSISGNVISFIGGGENNSIVGSYIYESFIGGGKDNTIQNYSYYSSILGGENNSVIGASVHIIGSNITGTTANTTYVENFNIDTTPSIDNTLTDILVRDTDGTIKIREIASSGATQITSKFVVTTGFTQNVTLSITHNMGVSDECSVSFRDTINNEEIGGSIDNFQANSLDVTLSQTFTSVKVVIIG